MKLTYFIALAGLEHAWQAYDYMMLNLMQLDSVSFEIFIQLHDFVGVV